MGTPELELCGDLFAVIGQKGKAENCFLLLINLQLKNILKQKYAVYIICIFIQAGQFGAPSIGPKEAEKNIRNFSEDKLKAGQTIISLQYGSNKGANQSGLNFGNTRHM